MSGFDGYNGGDLDLTSGTGFPSTFGRNGFAHNSRFYGNANSGMGMGMGAAAGMNLGNIMGGSDRATATGFDNMNSQFGAGTGLNAGSDSFPTGGAMNGMNAFVCIDSTGLYIYAMHLHLHLHRRSMQMFDMYCTVHVPLSQSNVDTHNRTLFCYSFSLAELILLYFAYP